MGLRNYLFVAFLFEKGCGPPQGHNLDPETCYFSDTYLFKYIFDLLEPCLCGGLFQDPNIWGLVWDRKFHRFKSLAQLSALGYCGNLQR